MKNLLKQNRKGNATDIIGTSICLLALMIVFISFVYFTSIIEYKRSLNDITRNYLLKVETTGKLTADELQKFQEDVEALRPSPNGTFIVTVSFNENNLPSQYGEEVSVKAHVTASHDALGLTQIYGMIKDTYEFETDYHSTSKQ